MSERQETVLETLGNLNRAWHESGGNAFVGIPESRCGGAIGNDPWLGYLALVSRLLRLEDDR